MSLWSTLAKVAMNVGPAIVTGGASLPATLAATAASAAPDLISAIGGAAGKATAASGQNRLNQQQLALQANRDNVSGNDSFERNAIQRAQQEMLERKQALKDLTLANDVKNPHTSQFNTQGPHQYSPEYLAGISDLEKRAIDRMHTPEAYSTDKMPTLASYKPLPATADGLQDATGTKKGILESIGDWAGPSASILGSVMRNRVGTQQRPDQMGDFNIDNYIAGSRNG